jgi:hypothetical protein
VFDQSRQQLALGLQQKENMLSMKIIAAMWPDKCGTGEFLID